MIIMISEVAGITPALLIILPDTGMMRRCMFMTNAVTTANNAYVRWKRRKHKERLRKEDGAFRDGELIWCIHWKGGCR